MGARNNISLLRGLGNKELKEICERYNLKGFSGLKKNELAHFIAKSEKISDEEIESLSKIYIRDKKVGKIRDSKDYFLTKQVDIKYFGDDTILGMVGGYKVIINNLGKESFSYTCDERCMDYQYQVSKGKYPFCMHYPSVIAELIVRKDIDPEQIEINHISDESLNELIMMVQERKKQDGLITIEGRNIEKTLSDLREDFFKISMQDNKLSRDKYHDIPQNVFESLVEKAFLLLDFDTISKRKDGGWDLIIIGGRMIPPYIGIGECKTATSGIYNYLHKDPEYLIRLKNYCTDMVRDKMYGAYKDYVKYMFIVAPGFPEEVKQYCDQFHGICQINLSFWPVQTLLYLVEKYRQNPILTHRIMEELFMKKKLLEKDDIDEKFIEAEKQIASLISRAKLKLRQRIEQFSRTSTDACYIKFDTIIVQSILNDIISLLSPEILDTGKKVTGIETINIKHDYFKIWDIVLTGLKDEFVEFLRETSFAQVKSPEMRDELIKLLSISY